ncbi:MAG TPA: ABC transporter permease, partial [Ktedonobacterales bacterium]|nr:ABC transporter permease [Ktedonobacterales bacterium]
MRRTGRAPVGSAVRLAGMRLTHQWRLLLAVALGILVAVVLICTVPLYNTLVADVELQRVLTIAQPAERNIDASVQSQRVDAAAGAAAQAQVLALGRQYLAGFTAPAITSSAESAQMLILRLPDYVFQPANSNTPRVVFQAIDFTAAAPHMTFLSGGPPQDSSQAPQVIVTHEMATDHGLHVSSTFEVTQFGDHRRTVMLVVSGIWQPTDVNDPYWNGRSFEAHSGKESSDVYPVQLPASTFYAQLAPFDQVSMTQHLVYYTHPAAITITNMDGIADGIASFRAHMNGDVQPQPGVEAVGVATALDHDIQDIRAQQTLLVFPLYVIVAQVVGLALLFVIAMAGLLIEGQSQEIATLKSRGASGWQILGTFTAQSALLALLAAVAGPFIAVLLALVLTRWFVPASLQYGGAHSNYLTGVAQPQSVVAPAIVGALLGVAAVAFSALQSARLDVLAFRREQGRASRQPLWRRYYLDLLLAVLCVAGYVELGQFGGVATALDHDIQDIRAQQTLLVLPLYVIVAQVVGLALLFVIAMAGLLIEGQSQEIATLKSRGASGWQILGTFTAQSALLALLAAVAGPFIAVLLALALTRWFVPASLQYG